jgi:hypothetical protein
MTKQEVIDLMSGSKTEKEWNENCDKVKAAFNGYPDFWYAEIVLSGIAGVVCSKPGFKR